MNNSLGNLVCESPSISAVEANIELAEVAGIQFCFRGRGQRIQGFKDKEYVHRGIAVA